MVNKPTLYMLMQDCDSAAFGIHHSWVPLYAHRLYAYRHSQIQQKSVVHLSSGQIRSRPKCLRCIIIVVFRE